MGNLKPAPYTAKANPGQTTCRKHGLPFPYRAPKRLGDGRPAAAAPRAAKRPAKPAPKKKRARG